MPAPASRETPIRLGRYEIVGRLGAGGMAEILLGRQLGASGFSRIVAIKRMRPELLGSSDSVKLFVHEVSIAAELRHPNVVTVHDVAEESGEIFVVLEYLEGETISGLLLALGTQRSALDPRLAAHLVAEACAGLHAAHELVGAEGRPLELVHRDVSPSNLFVTLDGHVKVLDFGIAKTAGRSTLTEIGHVRGKLAYMSPEQCTGGEVDRRSDVFSLGVVLYELLAGKRLFARPNPMATAEAVCRGPIAPPSSVCACPPSLDAIVLRALERRLEARYPTAMELRADLLAFLGRAPGPMPEVTLATLMQTLFGEQTKARRQMFVSDTRVEAAVLQTEDDIATASEEAPRRVSEPTSETITRAARPALRRIGRYVLLEPLAAGGVGQVYWGCVLGVGGFSRVVAMKRMHSWLAEGAAAMLLDEARLASRIHHPNVVDTLDLVAGDGETFLVMEYVEGEALHRLRARGPIPPEIAVAIVADALRGLHAAHGAIDAQGSALGVVHRDVSPENLLVGVDGLARVLDFGVAKARERLQETTQSGRFKGKLAYMAPEQLASGEVTPATDVFAAGIVLWSALTAKTSDAIVGAGASRPPPSTLVPGLPRELDAIVAKATEEHPRDRFASAEAFADALETLAFAASPRVVATWLESVAGADLAERRARVAASERRALEHLGELSEAPSAAPAQSLASALPPAAVPKPTSAEVTAPLAEPPPKKRRSVLFAALALAALLAAAGIALRTPTNASDSKPVVDEPAKSATLATAEPQAATASASASPTMAPLASSPPKASAPPKERPRAPPPPKPPVPSCKPPYVLDADGVRHFKPECRNAAGP